MSSYVYYLELHAICLWLLLWLLLTIRRTNDFRSGRRIFYYEIALTMVELMLDVLKAGLNGVGGLPVHITLNVANILYTMCGGFIVMGWFTYGVILYRKDIAKNYTLMVGISVPHFMLLVLAVSSPWTQLIFYIDEHNLFHKGSLYRIQDILIYGYFLYVFILMIHRNIKKIRIAARRTKIPPMIATTVFFIAVALVTYFANGLDSLWATFSVYLVFAYMEGEFGRITLDSLTGLNNRMYFDDQITRATQSYNSSQGELFLFMLDVDFFKKINDSYGHIEGDIALKQVAQVLRETCGNEKTVLARYGGDEFACIFHAQSVEDAERLKNKIIDAFEKRNDSTSTTYPISVSIGSAQFGVDGVYNDIELINKADADLYTVKKLTHRNARLAR